MGVMRCARFLAVVLLSSLTAAAHEDPEGKGAADKPRYDYAKARETPFGKPFDPRRAKREIAIDMSDTMRYSPAQVVVKRGESVRFLVRNRGKQVHEMVLGTRKDLEEHAEMMRRHPGMEHDEPHMVHVAPGRIGQVGWQFTKAGEFFYGCLVPGHFEAGMVGRIVVH
jgi:uncharacterized cupredoxin-like copper-binding protein